MRRSHSLPPGPSAPRLAQTALLARDPIGFTRSCAERFGPVFTLRLLPRADVVKIADPELVGEVFAAPPGRYLVGRPNRVMEPVLGARSLFLLDADRHRSERSLLLDLLRPDRLARHEPAVRELVARTLTAIPLGRPFPVHQPFRAMTLRAVLETLVGANGSLTRLEHLISRFVSLSASPLANIQALRRDLGRWSPWARFLATRVELDTAIRNEIERRRESPRDDLLSEMIGARREDGSRLSRAELRDEFVTLAIAGHETTAASLAWTIERLTRTPVALARFTEEGTEPDSPYLAAVIRAALKSRPVVLSVTRELATDLRIGDFELPKGTILQPVIAPAAMLAADPEVDRFEPERFLDGEQAAGHPFGGGNRRCVGASFALWELRLMLAEIAHRVRLRGTDRPAEQPRLPNFTLVPNRGARAVLEAR